MRFRSTPGFPCIYSTRSCRIRSERPAISHVLRKWAPWTTKSVLVQNRFNLPSILYTYRSRPRSGCKSPYVSCGLFADRPWSSNVRSCIWSKPETVICSERPLAIESLRIDLGQASEESCGVHTTRAVSIHSALGRERMKLTSQFKLVHVWSTTALMPDGSLAKGSSRVNTLALSMDHALFVNG